MKRNFLYETFGAIKATGHEPSDIQHIGNEQFGCSWSEFVDMADFNYDTEGSKRVLEDLLIVFSDYSCLEWSGDSVRWWTWTTPPKIPVNPKKLKTLTEELTDEL